MADHDVDIYMDVNGKWYWSCATCETAGEVKDVRADAEQEMEAHKG